MHVINNFSLIPRSHAAWNEAIHTHKEKLHREHDSFLPVRRPLREGVQIG